MINMGLIPEKKMEKSKEVIKTYKEFKFKIYKRAAKDNELTIIYDIEDKNEIKIFGNEFVNNNSDKCKIVINNE